MKPILMLTTVLCLMGISAQAYGQSAGYDTAQFEQSVEARIGVVLPFGGNYKKTKSKPQLAFSLRSEAPHNYQRDWALLPSVERDDYARELKLALTFEREPSLLLNNQLMSFGEGGLSPEGGLNALDTYDKTILGVIGVSLVVIAGSILIFREG